jgi:ABC-2 type transport system ATP-binding protein
VVILDEPMSGLDPVGRKMVGDLLIDLKQRGKTVFFSSHILNDVERFCDRVGIAVGGRLRLLGTISELTAGHADLETVFLAEVAKAATAGGGAL